MKARKITEPTGHVHQVTTKPRHAKAIFSIGSIAASPVGSHRRVAIRRPGAQGANGSAAKLSDADASRIIERYRSGEATQQELADEYGVSQGHISGLVNGNERARRGSAVN